MNTTMPEQEQQAPRKIPAPTQMMGESDLADFLAATLKRAESIGRWNKALSALLLPIAGLMGWMAVTGAAILATPQKTAENAVRIDSVAVLVGARMDTLTVRFNQHVQAEGEVNRAQTCILKQMAASRDPSGCVTYLENSSYYDPPAPEAQ